MAAILTTPIEPIGFQLRQGRQQPVWTPTPESKLLAMMRQQFGLTARAAAEALGIEVWELNELEAGGRTCEWDEVYSRLAKAGETPA